MALAERASLRGLGLALLAGATLLAEVTWTRLFSVAYLHVFAFLAVSTALLGAGLGARWVAAFAARTDRQAAMAAAAFAVLVPLSQIVVGLVGFDPMALRSSGSAWLGLGLVYLATSLPLAASGAGIAILLSARPERAPTLYAYDLVGAAAGSLLGLWLVPALDGTGALWAASGLGLASAALLGFEALWAASVLAVLAAFWVPLPLGIAPSKTTASGASIAAVLSDPGVHLGAVWTAHARVDRVRFAPGQERLLIDAGAAAVRIPLTPMRRTPTDATLPYELRPGGRVLVIGSGAGWEVAEAVAFGASEVVGVEVNRAVIDASPAFLRSDPRVELVLEDARTFLERPGPAFDAVVMIHTISNAATAAGALGLTEDHLLTVEAFSRILGRLAPDGLLFVTRPDAQIPRLVATLEAASGGPIDDKLALWREPGGFYAAALLGKAAFEPETERLIAARLAERKLVLDHLPRRPDGGAIGAIARGEPLSPLERALGLRLAPATDDAPFFHRKTPLTKLATAPAAAAAPGGLRLALEERPLAELALLALLVESVLIGGIVLMPVRAAPAPIGARLCSAAAFGSVGLAFMALEIGLVQRLGLLLGASSRALAIGFAGILLGAGIGSRLAAGAAPRGRALIAAAGGLGFAFAAGPAVAALLPASLGVRSIAAAAMAGSLGLALGGVFPSMLAAGPAGGAAAAFAVNAVASVAGTAIALLLAPEVGISGLALGAAALYGIIGALLVRSR